jgi:hypothetical protein
VRHPGSACPIARLPATSLNRALALGLELRAGAGGSPTPRAAGGATADSFPSPAAGRRDAQRISPQGEENQGLAPAGL